MRRVTPTLLICLVAATTTAVALARPGSPSADGSDPSSEYASPVPPEATDGRLVIADFAFSPVTAPAGSTVVVVNEDDATHTVTASDGVFDTGRIEALGEAEITAPGEPGDYRFFCAIHPSMAGILVVEG